VTQTGTLAEANYRAGAQYDWTGSDMERLAFGRERRKEEVFGVYRRTTAAQATDEEIRLLAQDGGIVTALLVHGLRTGYFSRAVVSGVDPNKPLYPVPKVTSNSSEVLACAGTRYSCSPNLLALAPVAEEGIDLAFVGTPCQISAIRKMQSAALKKYNSVKLLIGLMCSECFDHETLVEKHLHRELGLNLKDILKINIKGKMIITMKNGQALTRPLGEVKKYARKSCRFCSDFSSELADISIGGLGLEGWSFVVVRSEKGEQLFSSAEKAKIIQTRNSLEEENALKLLCKLSSRKAKNQSSKSRA
jgi:coenzyme F420 hydrogenase subunit beta